EGHGVIGAELLLTDPRGAQSVHPMTLVGAGTDRWRARLALPETGVHRWRVRAFSDDWGSWLHAATIKIGAGDDPELVFAMGAELLERVPGKTAADARAAFLDATAPAADRLKVASDRRLVAQLNRHPVRSLVTESEELELVVERARAAVGAWYEFFPRSEGAKRRADG